MLLRIETKTDGDTLTVELSGEFDMGAIADFRAGGGGGGRALAARRNRSARRGLHGLVGPPGARATQQSRAREGPRSGAGQAQRAGDEAARAHRLRSRISRSASDGLGRYAPANGYLSGYRRRRLPRLPSLRTPARARQPRRLRRQPRDGLTEEHRAPARTRVPVGADGHHGATTRSTARSTSSTTWPRRPARSTTRACRCTR